MVLRGQAVEGGGLAYQLWREPVRRLALAADELSDMDAGILMVKIQTTQQSLFLTLLS